MRGREKKELLLASTEEELLASLKRDLPYAVETGWDPFCNSRFDPFDVASPKRNPEAEQLLSLSESCLALRAELELPREEGPGFLFIRACEESADVSNPHRLGPRRLAERLLGELFAA